MKETEKNKLLKQAVHTWGEDAQFDMAVEECAELITAVQHYKRGRVTKEQLLEELADVKVMNEQLGKFIGEHEYEKHYHESLRQLEERIKIEKD